MKGKYSREMKIIVIEDEREEESYMEKEFEEEGN